MADFKPMESFTVGREANGRRIWKCSECGQQAAWGDGWAYYGSIEGDDADCAVKVLCPTCMSVQKRVEWRTL